MLLCVILLVASQVSTLVAGAEVGSGFELGSNGILKPKDWKRDVYPVASGTNPSQYIVTTTWNSKDTCTGAIDLVTGTGFDVCYTDGYLSYMNKNPSVQNDYVYFSTDNYSTKDCSGTKKSTLTYQEPMACKLSEGNTGRKYAYSLVNSTTPWTSAHTPGVVTKGYFDASSCSGGGSSAVFTLASPSNCVSTGGVYPKYTYEKWTACNYGYITVSEYTGDLYCENLVLTSTKSVKLSTCVANAKNYDTETQICYN